MPHWGAHDERPSPEQSWRRALWPLLCVVGLFGLSGASCPQMVQQYKIPVTREVPLPTLAVLTATVNDNSARIRELSSNQATLSGEQFPSLRANLAVSRPMRFRLVAEKSALTGTEFDMGSNDEQFWLWIQRSRPPALYYCRHDQFATSAARQVFPVEPAWLIEALGVVTFEPGDVHEGPTRVGRGRLEVRSTLHRPSGTRVRVVIFDDENYSVLAEHLYDDHGNRIASATMSEHERDVATGAVLPRKVDIEWPATKFTLQIAMRELNVNRIDGDPKQLWARPEYRGWRDTDLADPNFQLPPPSSAPYDPPGDQQAQLVRKPVSDWAWWRRRDQVTR